MARIPYVEAEQSTEKTRDILEKNNHGNIFRMLGHSESHLYNYCRLGNAIRFKGELDPGLREIAITRTGILCNSEYEVIAHKRLCAAAGVSDEKIDALELLGSEHPSPCGPMERNHSAREFLHPVAYRQGAQSRTACICARALPHEETLPSGICYLTLGLN